MDTIQEQGNNSRPWLFQKGKSGNPGGRPKGSKTMKAFVKEYLAGLSDEEKVEFLEGLPKEVIWKMAEGMPQSSTDVTSAGMPIPLFSNVPNKTDAILNNDRDAEDKGTE